MKNIAMRSQYGPVSLYSNLLGTVTPENSGRHS